jgi:hypothetical protein
MKYIVIESYAKASAPMNYFHAALLVAFIRCGGNHAHAQRA